MSHICCHSWAELDFSYPRRIDSWTSADFFKWDVVGSRGKSLMMWSLAAIFDSLTPPVCPPLKTWECNSAASGNSAIFKTHFISLAPPLSASSLRLSIWLREELRWICREGFWVLFFSGTQRGGEATGRSEGQEENKSYAFLLVL